MYLPLNRHWNKRLAVILIVIGVLLLPDVIAPTPFMDLLLNVPLAWILADLLTISYLSAFVLTYIISFLLVIAGLMIWPYNTKRLIKGKFHHSVTFMKTHPFMVLLAIFGLLVVYFMGQYLYDTLWQYSKEIVSGLI